MKKGLVLLGGVWEPIVKWRTHMSSTLGLRDCEYVPGLCPSLERRALWVLGQATLAVLSADMLEVRQRGRGCGM